MGLNWPVGRRLETPGVIISQLLFCTLITEFTIIRETFTFFNTLLNGFTFTLHSVVEFDAFNNKVRWF